MATPCWNSGFGTSAGYPRQTTSAIHEYLQKHNKGTKLAIWKRLLNVPEPKTNCVQRTGDSREPHPTPEAQTHHLRNLKYLLSTSSLPQEMCSGPLTSSRQVGAAFGSRLDVIDTYRLVTFDPLPEGNGQRRPKSPQDSPA